MTEISVVKKKMIKYAGVYSKRNFTDWAEKAYQKYVDVAENFAVDGKIKVTSTPFKKSSWHQGKNGTVTIHLKVNGSWKPFVEATAYFVSKTNAKVYFYNHFDGHSWEDAKPWRNSDITIQYRFYDIIGDCECF